MNLHSDILLRDVVWLSSLTVSVCLHLTDLQRGQAGGRQRQHSYSLSLRGQGQR